MQILQGQHGEFRNPHAGCIKQFQQGPITHGPTTSSLGGRQQTFHFTGGQGSRKNPPQTRGLHGFRYIPDQHPLLLKKFKENLDGHQGAGNRIHTQPSRPLGFEKINHAGTGDCLHRRNRLFTHKRGKPLEIRLVGRPGMNTEPTLP